MKSKMVGLFAVLMIALMVAGLAYAHWEKIITINGTVSTGTLELEPSFSVVGITGTEGWLPEPPTNKPVSYIKWTINDNTLTVTINNTHPCLWVNGTFDIHNTGTIPAGLHKVDVTAPSGVTLGLPKPGEISVYDGGKLIAHGVYEISGNFKQIDPGKKAEIKFMLHFEEDLPQGKTYEFTIKLTYYNWNEA
jgi:hypothetical protein